jgi:transposase
MDLYAFYRDYRHDGHGRAAHDPQRMVALLLYAYAKGQRSSRGIERACTEDVAFRVIAANQAPDHTTIARFRRRHEQALADLFSEVLYLCAKAGLVNVGVLAVDGTKVYASADRDANRHYGQIAKEILEQAAEVDRQEDEQFGDARGDELPPHLSTNQGRRGWLREARRALDEKRAQEAKPIPRSRPQRLTESKRRLEEELAVESRANAAYEHHRVHGRDSVGRRLGAQTKPYSPPTTPAWSINTTDLDSRLVKATDGYIQGYNAQAVTNDQQIVIAAEVTVDSPDFGHLGPMVAAARAELQKIGVSDTPGLILADSGYWHQAQMESIVSAGSEVIIPPDASRRKGTRPGWEGGLYAFMRNVLQTDSGRDLYRRRQGMIEPVFAHTKFNRRIDRFQRRGRSAARSEWRLITATHNLRA